MQWYSWQCFWVLELPSPYGFGTRYFRSRKDSCAPKFPQWSDISKLFRPSLFKVKELIISPTRLDTVCALRFVIIIKTIMCLAAAFTEHGILDRNCSCRSLNHPGVKKTRDHIFINYLSWCRTLFWETNKNYSCFATLWVSINGYRVTLGSIRYIFLPNIVDDVRNLH